LATAKKEKKKKVLAREKAEKFPIGVRPKIGDLGLAKVIRGGFEKVKLAQMEVWTEHAAKTLGWLAKKAKGG